MRLPSLEIRCRLARQPDSIVWCFNTTHGLRFEFYLQGLGRGVITCRLELVDHGTGMRYTHASLQLYVSSADSTTRRRAREQQARIQAYLQKLNALDLNPVTITPPVMDVAAAGVWPALPTLPAILSVLSVDAWDQFDYLLPYLDC